MRVVLLQQNTEIAAVVGWLCERTAMDLTVAVSEAALWLALRAAADTPLVVLDCSTPSAEQAERTTRIVTTLQTPILIIHPQEHFVTALLPLARGPLTWLSADLPLFTMLEQLWLAQARIRQAGTNQAPAPLSERERQVLTRIGEGLSDTKIAAALYVSSSTVKSHVKTIKEKLDVTERPELAAFAQQMRDGLSSGLSPSPDQPTRENGLLGGHSHQQMGGKI